MRAEAADLFRRVFAHELGEKGDYQLTLKVHSEMSGSAEAEQLFGEWARLLRRALEAARETPETGTFYIERVRLGEYA